VNQRKDVAEIPDVNRIVNVIKAGALHRGKFSMLGNADELHVGIGLNAGHWLARAFGDGDSYRYVNTRADNGESVNSLNNESVNAEFTKRGAGVDAPDNSLNGGGAGVNELDNCQSNAVNRYCDLVTLDKRPGESYGFGIDVRSVTMLVIANHAKQRLAGINLLTSCIGSGVTGKAVRLPRNSSGRVCV